MSDLYELKQEIKLELINYYDDIKNRIDIETQTKLLSIEKGQSSDKNKQKMLDLYERLVRFSDDYFDMNCKQIDNYFNNKFDSQSLKTKTEVKKESIENYCFFLENSLLNNDFKNENQIGLFITFDWYLDENQMNFIKAKTQKRIQDIKFVCNEYVVNLIHGFDLLEDQDFEVVKRRTTSCFKNVHFFEKNILIDYISTLTKTRLDLSFNDECCIIKIEKNSFKNYTNLESLELTCSKNLINNGIFSEFFDKRLQELYINTEKIELVDSDLFSGLNRLIGLSLFNCQITNIQKEALKTFECLKKLDLSWNKMANISLDIFNQLINLECLLLIKCDLKTIENLSLKKLKELNLKMNELTIIKPKLFNELNNLKLLNLSKCGISTFENNSFINLMYLEELDFSENNIKRISCGMLNGLKNLRVLDLKKCEILSIDDNSFKCNTNLKELYLNKNKIEKLTTKTFEGLTNLIHLDLRDNNLNTKNKEAFVNLKNLESLFLVDIYFISHSRKLFNKNE